MNRKINLQSVGWDCPSIENRKILQRPGQNLFASMEDPSELVRLLEENTEDLGKRRYILPVWQNLESVVYGTRILDKGRYWIPGDYCLENLSDIEDVEFNLLDHPLIRAVIEVIPLYRDRPLILELEAPFSILSALMNPMDLYLYFEEETELLLDILFRMAEASATYVKACAQAGCRFFSLADPVGTLNLVGEGYFKKFCGSSAIHFMKKCQDFLDQAVMHLCLKQSRSLVMTGMARAEQIEIPAGLEDYTQILSLMADDPDIHFTGMTCIHNARPNLEKSCRIII